VGEQRKLMKMALLAGLAAILLLTPALAQNDDSGNTDSGNNTSRKPKSELVQHVPAVPQRPWDYHPITPDERLKWFVRATVGPKTLVGGLFSAGIGTAGNWPHEYGTHWVGFGQRYGMRLTGVSTSNAIESTLGAAWGEDPRYFHTVNQPFPARAKNVLDLTFRAYRTDGERHMAYARWIAVFGNNFLSNSWRVPSESNFQHAMVRSAEGFGARFLSDAFNEFVPAVWQKVRHHSDHYADVDGP
jgi:hypothetical protein